MIRVLVQAWLNLSLYRACLTDRLWHAGTSSFGMSGVNCNLLVGSSSDTCSHFHTLRADSWQKERVWATPAVTRLLMHASVPEDRLEVWFVAHLDLSSLAYLQDHRCGPVLC